MQEKAIELLVKHGAELECRTPHGETPLGMGLHVSYIYARF